MTDQQLFVVSIWNYKSEYTYTFGPFTEDQLDDFDAKVWENDSYDYNTIMASAINKPDLFGTGNEIG